MVRNLIVELYQLLSGCLDKRMENNLTRITPAADVAAESVAEQGTSLPPPGEPVRFLVIATPTPRVSHSLGLNQSSVYRPRFRWWVTCSPESNQSGSGASE
jgi:hypothetical protein